MTAMALLLVGLGLIKLERMQRDGSLSKLFDRIRADEGPK